MFCSKCGKELPEDANVCSNCGNRVKGAVKPQPNQKFDLTDVQGTFNQVVANVKESWANMGKQGMLLAIMGGLLLLCMFMWRGDIIAISPKEYSRYYNFTYELKGTEILNENGFMIFLVTVGYLVSLGAVAYPFITNTAVTKNLLKLTGIGIGLNLGAFIGCLIFGFGQAGDLLGGMGISNMMDYINILPSAEGWLLLIMFVAVPVLGKMVEKEI